MFMLESVQYCVPRYEDIIEMPLVSFSARSQSGLASLTYKCAFFGGLSMVLLQLKDPLELFVKRREFLLGSGFLSRHDIT